MPRLQKIAKPKKVVVQQPKSSQRFEKTDSAIQKMRDMVRSQRFKEIKEITKRPILPKREVTPKPKLAPDRKQELSRKLNIAFTPKTTCSTNNNRCQKRVRESTTRRN